MLVFWKKCINVLYFINIGKKTSGSQGFGITSLVFLKYHEVGICIFLCCVNAISALLFFAGFSFVF